VADIKLSQLSSASSMGAEDLLLVTQNSISKRVSLSVLLKNLNSNDTIKVNATQAPVSTIIASRNRQFLLNVDGVNDYVGINTQTPESLFHVNGNLQVGSTSADGVITSSREMLSHSGAAVIDKPISVLRETSGIILYGTSTYVLSNGIEGQTKNIYIDTITSAGSATIAVAAGRGFTSIAFSPASVGQGIHLKFINSKWVCLGNNGATLS
jgi:hypothetical protein